MVREMFQAPSDPVDISLNRPGTVYHENDSSPKSNKSISSSEGTPQLRGFVWIASNR